LSASTNGTWAYGINDAGQVVGSFNPNGGGATQGFIYSNGSYSTLHVPGSLDTEAYGINNAGQVVGHYNSQQSFLYSGGTHTDISDPSATDGTYAFGINDLGQAGHLLRGRRAWHHL
jgi:probable HAF family extracellular repeat protein